MRGRAALLPVGFAIAFGIINGYSIFQPLIVEDRLKTLQARGTPGAVPSMASTGEKSEAAQTPNANERVAKKDLEKPKADAKPVT